MLQTMQQKMGDGVGESVGAEVGELVGGGVIHSSSLMQSPPHGDRFTFAWSHSVAVTLYSFTVTQWHVSTSCASVPPVKAGNVGGGVGNGVGIGSIVCVGGGEVPPGT